MRIDGSDAKADRMQTSPRGANIWVQRSAGVVLGGLAGTAVAFSTEFWPSAWDALTEVPNERVVATVPLPAENAAPIPAPDTAETARQIAHALASRARDLIARGEIREAERFVGAAERLAPETPALDETRRLLTIAKVKLELADLAPASGPAARTQSAPPAAAAKSAADDFAAGVKEFREKDYAAALQYFVTAADAGHAAAQNYLGYMHRHGLGVAEDYAQALAWYRKAAAQDHPGALNNIGYMYRHGLGVSRDYAEARVWFTRAAERGDAAGAFNLAQMLAAGIGAAPDQVGAARWFRAAADRGHARAAMGLAHLYRQGNGVTADPAEAYFWYGVAERGDVEGAPRFRAALGAQLSTEERAKTDARLARWRAQSADGETR